MSIRDALNQEGADATRAAQAAATGVSLTGLSNKHRERGTDEPIFGERVDPAAIRGMEPGTEIPPGLAKPQLRQAMAERERIPFGNAHQRLYWAPRPGYRRYWFNDTAGRIGLARRAGYEHVVDPETGSKACRIVGTDRGGRDMKGYLMEIPIEWYWQDMQVAQDQRDRDLNQIKSGQYGPGADDHRYAGSSKGGISIKFGTGRSA
jgi:hypothetical protein